MRRGVPPDVDDVLVDKGIVSAHDVLQHFSLYGLECKSPQRAAEDARLLSMRVGLRDCELRGQRDSEIPAPTVRVIRRALFACCGQLVAHLLVAGWLRP